MDRIQLLDTTLRNHFVDFYSPVVKNNHNEDSPIYFASSMRAFSEMQSKHAATKTPNPLTRAEIDDTKRLPIPRISIMRQNVDPDLNRQRPPWIEVRAAAYHDDTKAMAYSTPFPIPINLGYQVDFWTRKQSEMNRWLIQFHRDFQLQVLYLRTVVDDFWRTKFMGIILESGPDDTSDLEPGEDRTLIRQTAIFTSQTWIWPTMDEFRTSPTVKDIILQLESPEGTILDTIDSTCGGN